MGHEPRKARQRNLINWFCAGAIAFHHISFAQDASGGKKPTDEESIIRPGWLHFSATELAVEFEAGIENRRVGSDDPRTRSQRNRDIRFEEAVQLRLDGDIVDPLLVNWQADLKLGLAQERFQERIGSEEHTDSDSGFLREFDISLNILPEKPLSFSAYARRVRDRIPRRFLPSLLEERSEAGITGLLRLDNGTTEFGVEWSDVEQSGNRDESDDESLESTRAFLDNRFELGEGHRLRVAFEHQRERSEYQGSAYKYDTRRDEVRAEHELEFGSNQQHRWDTTLRWNDEQGDLARDEGETTTRLTLTHSDAFRSIYRYSFYRTDQDEFEQDRHKVDGQFVYQPNRDLRITGDLFALRENSEHDAESQQFGGGMDAYFRRLTSHGEWRIDAGIQLDRERFLGDARGGWIRGESHVIDPTRPTYLTEPDIERATIVAYNLSRTRIYIPGSDYLIVAVGRRTVVYRMLAGRITEGEAILFDYQYRVPTGARIDSFQFDGRIEHAFSFGLTPYFATDVRRQDSDGARGVPVFEDNSERYRLGVRFNRARWSVFAEAELFDDSVEPYDAYHFGAKASLFRGGRQSMDANANVSWFNFTGDLDRRSVGLVDLGVGHRIDISEYLSSSLSTNYRWEDDTEDGETNGVDVSYEIQFRRGALEVDLTVEYDLLTVADNEEGMGVWLRVRRDLSHVLARSDRVRR